MHEKNHFCFRDPTKDFQKDVTFTFGPYPEDAKINIKVSNPERGNS